MLVEKKWLASNIHPHVDIRVRGLDRWQMINLGGSFSRTSFRQKLRGNRNQLGTADVEKSSNLATLSSCS